MDFDYNLYRLAVGIYQYAERVVIYPGDLDQIAYCRSEAKAALMVCREKGLNWLPVSKTCTGKKRAGRVAVTVEFGDTSYGFAHGSENAGKISGILDGMWKKYTHGEELDEILR